MEKPPVWSDNIVRNYERLIEWIDSVINMTEITCDDYILYSRRCTSKIQNFSLQNSIQNFGCNFGSILYWIEIGCKCMNSNPRLPTAFHVKKL